MPPSVRCRSWRISVVAAYLLRLDGQDVCRRGFVLGTRSGAPYCGVGSLPASMFCWCSLFGRFSHEILR